MGGWVGWMDWLIDGRNDRWLDQEGTTTSLAGWMDGSLDGVMDG